MYYTEEELEYYMQEAYNMGQEDLMQEIDSPKYSLEEDASDLYDYMLEGTDGPYASPMYDNNGDKAALKLLRNKLALKNNPTGKKYRNMLDITAKEWIKQNSKNPRYNKPQKAKMKVLGKRLRGMYSTDPVERSLEGPKYEKSGLTQLLKKNPKSRFN